MVLRLLPLLLLCGCAGPMVVAGASSLVVSETTGKSITDHAVSSANGKDCRVSRYFKDQPICQTEPKSTVVQYKGTGDFEQILAQRRNLTKKSQ